MRALLICLLISAGLTLASGHASAHSAMNRFWGEVPVDMTLTGDVLIVKPLIVPEGVTLTFEPGTVVRFEKSKDGANRIVVRGRLTAVGAKGSPIRFIPKDGESGPWQGVVFEGAGRGKMEHCVLTGSTAGVKAPKGAVEVVDVTVK